MEHRSSATDVRASVATPNGLTAQSRFRILCWSFAILWVATLVLATSAHATFMAPDLADRYTSLRSYTTTDAGGQTYRAGSFAFDGSGRLWVAHVSPDGAGLAVYEAGSTTPSEFYSLGERSVLGCAFDPYGFLYFTDPWAGEVVKYDPSTHTEVGTIVVGDFANPSDIHLDGEGNIFVSDSALSQVARVDHETQIVTVFEDPIEPLSGIEGFGFDGAGNLLVGDSILGGRLVRYAPDGTLIEELDVAPLGVGPIRDAFSDMFGTMYVLGDDGEHARFGRQTSDGTTMGVYPDPAEGVLQASTKLVIDTDGYAWANSNPLGAAGEVQRYTFVEGNPDTIAPTTSDDAPSAWVHGPVTVSLTASDTGGSGLAATYYSLNGSTPSVAPTGTVQVSAEGTNTLEYYSVDRSGNREATHSVDVRIDNFAPVSSALVAPLYYGAVHIDLSAMDALSGVAETRWSLDGGTSWTVGTSVDIPAEQRGTYLLLWYSVDNVGNSEFPVQEALFAAYNRYEQSAAQVVYRSTWTTETTGTWSGGSYARSSSATAAAYVTFSGKIIDVYGRKGPDMGMVRMRLDNGMWSDAIDCYASEATSTAIYRFTAAFGSHVLAIESLNTKNPLSSGTAIGLDCFDVDGTLMADTTPPATTDDGTTDWYGTASKLSLTAVDNSYVAQTLYRIGAGAVQSYNGPFTVPGDSDTVPVEYRSVDGAGNAETSHTVTLKVDSTPPVSSTNATSSYVDSATISLFATDSLSGVSKSQYSLDGSGWTDGNSVYVTGYGNHTLLYRAVDVAGNVETSRTAALLIRRASETYTITSPELNWAGSWSVYNGDAKRTSTYSTGNYVSGYGRATNIQVWAYKTDNAGKARVTLDGQVSVVDLYTSSEEPVLAKVYDSGTLPDRNHSLVFGYAGSKNYNSGGYRVNAHSMVVEGVFGGEVTDPDAPVTTSNIPGTWTTTPFQVELTQTDYLGNEGPTFYDVSETATDTPDATTAYEAPFTVSREGTSHVSYYSVDQFGNAEAVKTQQLRLDSSPPTTTSNCVAAYTNSAAINLSATDAYSGVASTHYRLDGAAWTTGSVPAVTAGNAGTHTVEWYSVDQVGNREATQSASFTVLDRFEQEREASVEQEGDHWRTDTDPRGSYGYARYANGPGALAGTFTGDRFDVIAAKQPDLGIARILIDNVEVGLCDQYSESDEFQSRVFSRTGLSEGIHTFKVQWTGLKNPASSGTDINVDAFELVGQIISDTEPPTSIATPDGLWRTTPELVSITATDNGVVAPLVHYRLNGGYETVYTDSFEVAAEGTTTIEYWATDGVNNEEKPHKTAFVRIDTTAPSVTPSAPLDWVRGPLYASLTTSDTASGIASVRYSTNGSAPSLPYPGGSGIYVSAEGTTTIRYQAADNLGNTSEVESIDVRLDRTSPSSADNAPSAWTSGTPSVTLNASDTPSGVAAIHFSLDGSPWSNYSAPVSVLGEGTHTLSYHAHDLADNQDATRTATVRVDNTPPVTTSDAPAAWQTSDVTVHLMASDALSGVNKTYYSP